MTNYFTDDKPKSLSALFIILATVVFIVMVKLYPNIDSHTEAANNRAENQRTEQRYTDEQQKSIDDLEAVTP